MSKAKLPTASAMGNNSSSSSRGRKVGQRGLSGQIVPIHSGILLRRGEKLAPAGKAFVDFLLQGRPRGQTS